MVWISRAKGRKNMEEEIGRRPLSLAGEATQEQPAASIRQPAGRPRLLVSFLMGCMGALAAVGLLALLVLGGLALLIAVPASMGGPVDTESAREMFRFKEVTVSGSPGQPKVVLVSVEGILWGPQVQGLEADPVSLLKWALQKAARDADVQAVVLVVDSPGGGITASDVMYKNIIRHKEKTGQPVVACMMDMAASGGYYVACGADWIVAHPTTITGSIGVLMPLYDATGLLQKVGIRERAIKSGSYKDLASPFAEKTEEERQRERQMLQELVDAMHGRFVGIVARGRRMELASVAKLADGRIFTSEQAKDNGLIDQIGYVEDAIDTAKTRANVSEAHVVLYRRAISVRELLGAFVRGPTLNIGLDDQTKLMSRRKPMYLWRPSPAE